MKIISISETLYNKGLREGLIRLPSVRISTSLNIERIIHFKLNNQTNEVEHTMLETHFIGNDEDLVIIKELTKVKIDIQN